MKIIRAGHLGMCFGVKDAIALATATARRERLTILGDLVHNETVLAELRAAGIQFRDHPDRVNTPTAMITAHGASERALKEARSRGLNIVEATCPLVHFAHRNLQQLVAQGFHPVIIGRRDHVEVRGLTGDLDDFDVVLTSEDVAGLRPRARFGVIAQTTQPIEKVRQLVAGMREFYPTSQIRFVDTVCQPTKQRQKAAIELARKCDVVVVIGGPHSNNTGELVKTCSQFCARVHHVQTAADLCSDWFFAADTVGITAGTSTPDAVIQGVEILLNAWAIQDLEGHKIKPGENISTFTNSLTE
jgi:4-hydroxy-3-methylbut-2-enyl diphosphate reductase